KLRRRLDGLAVHRHDDVTDLDARRFGRRAGLDLADERALVDAEAERFVERGRDVLNPDADPAASDLAVLEQLADDPLNHVARYREADADVAAGRREDGGIDSLQRAVHPDERASRVAGVDRRIRLDEILVTFDVDAAAAERAHDAGRRGLPDPERIADREHEVADGKILGIAECDLAQVVRFDPQQRNVGRRIAADDLCVELDRKSTRLNSSHVKISYAVFCLKKKK